MRLPLTFSAQTESRRRTAKVKMPNGDGFIPEQVFKLDNEPEAPPNGDTPAKLSAFETWRRTLNMSVCRVRPNGLAASETIPEAAH